MSINIEADFVWPLSFSDFRRIERLVEVAVATVKSGETVPRDFVKNLIINVEHDIAHRITASDCNDIEFFCDDEGHSYWGVVVEIAAEFNLDGDGACRVSISEENRVAGDC